jgi:hypothetical protein
VDNHDPKPPQDLVNRAFSPGVQRQGGKFTIQYAHQAQQGATATADAPSFQIGHHHHLSEGVQGSGPPQMGQLGFVGVSLRLI